MTEQHGGPPPAEVVAFLTKVFAYADDLPEAEGLALRRLVRAGLAADSGTIAAVLHADVAGYGAVGLPSTPAWYWPGADGP